MTTRRDLLSVAACGALAPFVAGARERRARPPNIVFILADDLGFADLSCYGNTAYRTRHVDRLAGEGMRLTRAYANSCLCSPTRLALMTGRYQHRLPAGLEEPIRPAVPGRTPVGLPPDHPTLASLLRAAGYRTALVGKWHLGFAPHFGPLKSGYEEFFGFDDSAINYYTHRDDSGREQLREGDETVRVDGYVTDLLTDRAVAYLARRSHRADGPFLLSLHHAAPHWPWIAPGDRTEAERIRRRAHYDGGSLETFAGMVLSLDQSVGRVLTALADTGLARETIVIFTSDNGGERYSMNWPLSGEKGDLLEGGLRVPAIVRWPGWLPRGQASNLPMITMDWTASLLGAAGVQPARDFPLDGQDVFPVLDGRAAARPRALCWRLKGRSQAACLEGDWKYLRIEQDEFLFDVASDPRERANRKELRGDVFERLKTAYAAWEAEMLPIPDETVGYAPASSDLAR